MFHAAIANRFNRNSIRSTRMDSVFEYVTDAEYTEGLRARHLRHVSDFPSPLTFPCFVSSEILHRNSCEFHFSCGARTAGMPGNFSLEFHAPPTNFTCVYAETVYGEREFPFRDPANGEAGEYA